MQHQPRELALLQEGSLLSVHTLSITNLARSGSEGTQMGPQAAVTLYLSMRARMAHQQLRQVVGLSAASPADTCKQQQCVQFTDQQLTCASRLSCQGDVVCTIAAPHKSTAIRHPTAELM